jgi:hypothetical protein
LALLIAILLCAANVDVPFGDVGTIGGVVINGSRHGEPMPDVEIVLRAGPEGSLVPAAKTESDAYGRFAFDDVPPDPMIVYLPGANRDGVHYPGPRVRLDPHDHVASVTIVAFDAVEAPSPLKAIRHDIDIDIGRRAIEVAETLTVANRTPTTYVGQAVEDKLPVTLRLSIPQSFDRVTFRDEFHGRRFWVADRQPVTDIPWPPGERELRFSYRIPVEEFVELFRRRLDVKTSNVRIRVRGINARQVSCNLPAAGKRSDDVVFASMDKELPIGFTIEVRSSAPPFPWVHYARWGSIVLLAALILATVVAPRVRRGAAKLPQRVEASGVHRPGSRQKSSRVEGPQREQRRRGSKKRAA